MRLINSALVLSIFTILAISCSNNKPSDYSTLKQKALEIPPDFQLEPPVEGEEEIINLPGSSESQDIQTILEDSASSEESSDDVVNKDMNLEEFVEENFLKKQEIEKAEEIIESVDEASLANEGQRAREELLKLIAIGNKEEDLVVENNSESQSEEELETITTESTEAFSEEEFLEELADTEDITSLPEEEQLQPMILDDIPLDDTEFDGEDLNDLLNRVDDLLNSYSN